MAWLVDLAHTMLALSLAVAPWLLAGLVLAGLIRAFLPQSAVMRIVGGNGRGAIVRAALVGLPLPLCSCGAIPAALQLRRLGAGRGPSTAFLVSTPGIGVDAMILSAVLLSPGIAVVRAVSAAALAIFTGFSVSLRSMTKTTDDSGSSCSRKSCCCGSLNATNPVQAAEDGGSLHFRLASGMRYVFTEMIDDIGVWLVIGLIMAAAVMTAMPPDSLAAYGSGLAAMAVVSLAGIPMYVCATAATPIAAAMIAGGVSPGTALVFLLAAPVTSLATLGVLRAEFGWRYLTCYVAAIAVGSVSIGLLTDTLFNQLGLTPAVISSQVPKLVPEPLAYAALVVLLMLAFRPLRRRLARTARISGARRQIG